MPALASSTLSRRLLVELLAEARARTILLVSPLSDEEMRGRPDESVQPILSELEQILRAEERWLEESGPVAENAPQPSSIGSYDEWFDAMMELRQRTLDRLESTVNQPGHSSILQRCQMVLEHEYRRNEAILETLQLSRAPYRAPRRTRLPQGRRLADPGFMTRFPGGVVQIGAAEEILVCPEEPAQRTVKLSPFWIDVTPVTNGEFSAFMMADGYRRADLWSEAGWEWVRKHD
ncbi:MAG TPA: SUMF1/EgtB/PvdO family nonheme iron enzyme, partial [Gemmatimonadales bacterium]